METCCVLIRLYTEICLSIAHIVNYNLMTSFYKLAPKSGLFSFLAENIFREIFMRCLNDWIFNWYPRKFVMIQTKW